METMSRRLMLGGLGAAPFASSLLASGARAQETRAEETPPQGTMQLPFDATFVEHVAAVVPDVRAATEFYSKLFNPAIMTEMNPDPLRCYVDLKPGYLALGSRAGQPQAFFDHFSVSIHDYDQEAVAAALGEAGMPQNNPAFTMTPDPNGVGVQLYSHPGGWFPTVIPMEPMVEGPSLVTPFGIEYVALNVADVAATVAFYRDMFGLIDVGDGPWTWIVFIDNFIFIRKAPEGVAPGLDHIRIRVEPFDVPTVVAELNRMGAVNISRSFVDDVGLLGFTDPQGLRVELMAIEPRHLPRTRRRAGSVMAANSDGRGDLE